MASAVAATSVLVVMLLRLALDGSWREDGMDEGAADAEPS